MEVLPVETNPQKPNTYERVRRKLMAVGAIGASAIMLAGGRNEQAVDFHASPAPPPDSPTGHVEMSGRYIRAAALERVTFDRPDEVAGPQVKLIYATASGGIDRQLDTNGDIGRQFWKSQDWQAARGDGFSLRMDTYKDADTSESVFDIGYLKLTQTASELAAAGTPSIESIYQQVLAAGYPSTPNKMYLVLYDGEQGPHPNQNGVLCGAGFWPPRIPGRAAIANLSSACGFNPGSNDFSYIDMVMPHEIFHSIGAVPESSPTYDGSAHTTDSDDMMHGKQQPTIDKVESLTIDTGKNGYLAIIRPWMTPDNFYDLGLNISDGGSVSSEAVPNKYFGEPACEDDCTMVFRAGQETTLQAFPERFYRLKGWTGSGRVNGKDYELKMNSEQNASAVFEPIAEIGVTVRRPSLGVVKIAGQKACRAVCSYEVPANSRVNLVAVPVKGARVVKWLGGNCLTKEITTQCSFRANQGPHKRTAVFAKK